MPKVHVSLKNEAQVRAIRFHNGGLSYRPYVGGHISGPKKGGMGLVMAIIALVMLAASLAGAWAVYTYLLMVL